RPDGVGPYVFSACLPHQEALDGAFLQGLMGVASRVETRDITLEELVTDTTRLTSAFVAGFSEDSPQTPDFSPNPQVPIPVGRQHPSGHGTAVSVFLPGTTKVWSQQK